METPKIDIEIERIAKAIRRTLDRADLDFQRSQSLVERWMAKDKDLAKMVKIDSKYRSITFAPMDREDGKNEKTDLDDSDHFQIWIDDARAIYQLNDKNENNRETWLALFKNAIAKRIAWIRFLEK